MAEVRLLRADDDRTQFRSGNSELDRFFVRFAGQNQFRHHVGATYVAIDPDRASSQERIVGFATLAPGHIEVADLPEGSRGRLPRYPLPVLRLARLAVHVESQGRGIGRLLLVTVFELAHDLARGVGCVGVVVDAKAAAVPFYTRIGFRRMEARAGALYDRPEPVAMYLPLSAVPRL